MAAAQEFILGEFRRTIDERHRLSLPAELVEPLGAEGEECVLAKERPGSLSLWNVTQWGNRLESSVDLVRSKMRAGRLEGRLRDVQSLGRLLSTRHKHLPLQARGRILIPEGFREFLGVEPGGDVLLVGAAVCVEIWHPERWLEYLQTQMPEFGNLLDDLAG
jgi:MraZ protein